VLIAYRIAQNLPKGNQNRDTQLQAKSDSPYLDGLS
jgi:hypothetical protein